MMNKGVERSKAHSPWKGLRKPTNVIHVGKGEEKVAGKWVEKLTGFAFALLGAGIFGASIMLLIWVLNTTLVLASAGGIFIPVVLFLGGFSLSTLLMLVGSSMSIAGIASMFGDFDGLVGKIAN